MPPFSGVIYLLAWPEVANPQKNNPILSLYSVAINSKNIIFFLQITKLNWINLSQKLVLHHRHHPINMEDGYLQQMQRLPYQFVVNLKRTFSLMLPKLTNHYGKKKLQQICLLLKKAYDSLQFWRIGRKVKNDYFKMQKKIGIQVIISKLYFIYVYYQIFML